jgi:hypothetical protein
VAENNCEQRVAMSKTAMLTHMAVSTCRWYQNPQALFQTMTSFLTRLFETQNLTVKEWEVNSKESVSDVIP